MNTTTIKNKKLSLKTQTLAAFLTIVSAVAIPQVFHFIGAVSGVGTAFGEIFLPMHLPIILAGLLFGAYAGAISGALAPLVSFALSGMPTVVMLPFMILELCAYGFFSGLLKNIKMPSVVKVLAVQLSGRLVRATAIIISFYAFENTVLTPAVIWTSISKGLFGIALQLVLIPLLLFRIEKFLEK